MLPLRSPPRVTQAAAKELAECTFTMCINKETVPVQFDINLHQIIICINDVGALCSMMQ